MRGIGIEEPSELRVRGSPVRDAMRAGEGEEGLGGGAVGAWRVVARDQGFGEVVVVVRHHLASRENRQIGGLAPVVLPVGGPGEGKAPLLGDFPADPVGEFEERRGRRPQLEAAGAAGVEHGHARARRQRGQRDALRRGHDDAPPAGCAGSLGEKAPAEHGGGEHGRDGHRNRHAVELGLPFPADARHHRAGRQQHGQRPAPYAPRRGEGGAGQPKAQQERVPFAEAAGELAKRHLRGLQPRRARRARAHVVHDGAGRKPRHPEPGQQQRQREGARRERPPVRAPRPPPPVPQPAEEEGGADEHAGRPEAHQPCRDRQRRRRGPAAAAEHREPIAQGHDGQDEHRGGHRPHVAGLPGEEERRPRGRQHEQPRAERAAPAHAGRPHAQRAEPGESDEEPEEQRRPVEDVRLPEGQQRRHQHAEVVRAAGDADEMLRAGVPPRVVAAERRGEHGAELVQPEHERRMVDAPRKRPEKHAARGPGARDLPADEQQREQRRKTAFHPLAGEKHQAGEDGGQRQKISAASGGRRREAAPPRPHLAVPLRHLSAADHPHRHGEED